MSSKKVSKIVSVFVAVATFIWVSGSAAFMPVAQALTIEEQIAALLAQISDLQAQLTALQGGTTSQSCSFTRSLYLGVSGDDVKCLQQYLNTDSATQVAVSGVGSSGSETKYFGPLTKNAVIKWQNKYAAQVLIPLGLSTGTGYWGSSSRSYYSTLASAQPTPTPTPTPGATPTPGIGTGLTVAKSATQPAAGLHPDNAVRVPYTAIDFTASQDGDVTIDSLTVERQGASTDATFSGVVLLDEDMVQVGLEKTLNSVHQATLTEDFTVPAGQTRTMYIAANRTTGGSDGFRAKFALVTVSTSAEVNGSLPIVGTEHTVNTGLTIGTATVETGPSKSVATTTEDVGKTMIFTAIKVSAGSTEDIELESIRFNQVGTIGSNDITDVEIKVDGTVYPHTISSDGKYYTAKFNTGESEIVITKGNNAEITIGGTLTGGTNRTIKFDVYRMTDIAVKGRLYGHGINPTASTGFTGTNPVYFASQITVGKATISVEKDPNVPAQNIAINLSDQPIAGFVVDVKGEPISVASLVFNVNRVSQSSGASARNAGNVDQIKLVDKESGNILAGPVDGSGTTVTFTDTVVFPVGKTYIKLVGKLDTNWVNNETVSASTTPSTNWTTVTGQNTGETITPTPSSAVSGNNMTVKGAAITISVAATPIAQSVVSGVQQFHFTTYQLDATQSGEDIRFVSIPLEYNVGASGTATNLTSCRIYDGDISLTTGSNVVNPTAAASSTTFTFDGSGLVVEKGTLKTLDLKCNIAGGASGKYEWGYDSSASPSATGLTSGQSATITENDSEGQLMTLVSSGSYTIVDDSTPGYQIVNSGATGVTLLQLKFAADYEDIDIQRVGFQLTGIASNTPINLVNNEVVLYDADAPTVELVRAQFTANGDYATSSILAGTFIVPKGGSKTMIVKGDIAAITSSGPMTRSGDLLKVDYDGNALGSNGGNYGLGVDSGTTISPSSSDTSVGGVRIIKAYPEFSFINVSDKTLEIGDNQKPLYRFSVTAGSSDDVYIGKLTFNISSTTISGNPLGTGNATTSKYTLTAYTDSGFSTGDTTAPGNGTGAGVINGGQCYGNNNSQGVNNSVGIAGDADIEIFPTTTCLTGTTTYKIPSGQTRYFELRANIASVESVSNVQESFTVRLRGDSAWPTTQQKSGNNASLSGEMFASGINADGTPSTSAGVDGDTNDDFIWSPGSTSTSPTIFDFDFTNGYQISGLPANDMPSVTFTSTN